jgi:Ulp1 family protease
MAPGKFLNGNIIDFWMCWLAWKEVLKESSVHIFISHFYTKLITEGYDSVAHWTANRGINVFEKKMIMIPANKQKHWSLCAVINAGYIDFSGVALHIDAFQVPVLVLLDSLKLHSLKEISENIRMWLNAEYSGIKSKSGSTIINAFTIHSVDLQDKLYIYIYIYIYIFAVITFLALCLIYILLFLCYVLVPAQENGFNCGIFLCRYAASMYYLQDFEIRFSDVRNEQPPLINILSLSPYFRFNQSDMDKFHAELLLIIKKLIMLYSTRNEVNLLTQADEEETLSGTKAATDATAIVSCCQMDLIDYT